MGMKARKPRTWRWVTRDTGGPDPCIYVWRDKPSIVHREMWGGGGFVAKWWPEEWFGRFGIEVPTDRPIKVEFSTREVE
jgi:hypothetical protein